MNAFLKLIDNVGGDKNNIMRGEGGKLDVNVGFTIALTIEPDVGDGRGALAGPGDAKVQLNIAIGLNALKPDIGNAFSGTGCPCRWRLFDGIVTAGTDDAEMRLATHTRHFYHPQFEPALLFSKI